MGKIRPARVSHNSIPKDARAARNLRQTINRFLKGKRPYDKRSPISVHFFEGITDGFDISNLRDGDRENLARKIESWTFKGRERFLWKANVSCYIITPIHGPLRIHPTVIYVGLKVTEGMAGSQDERVRKHLEFQACALRDKVEHG